jgi:hypothetical protein
VSRTTVSVGFVCVLAAAAALFLVLRSHDQEKRRGAGPGVERLDFERGNLSQYDAVQRTAPDRIRLVHSPVRQGHYAARFEVRHGDKPPDTTGNRAELIGGRGKAKARTERWYVWSTLFPRGYPIVNQWQTFLQWKNEGEGSPPLAMTVQGDEIRLSGGKQDGFHLFWRAPLRPGRWHDFTAHIKWSPDPRQGFVELWHGRRLVVPRTPTATMYRDGNGRPVPNYVKLGLYRSSGIRATQVLFEDGLRIGPTRPSLGRATGS